jgi:hypothetical protein
MFMCVVMYPRPGHRSEAKAWKLCLSGKFMCVRKYTHPTRRRTESAHNLHTSRT